MLTIDPSNISLIDSEAENNIIERGDAYMTELLNKGRIGASIGITLFGFIPLNVNNLEDLYYDLYNIHYKNRVKMRCTLELILRSMLDDVITPRSEYLGHVYDIGFVRYIIKLVKDSTCSMIDLHNVAMRRSLHIEETSLKNMFFNALSWLDKESYWYLFRYKIGLPSGIESMGMVVPKGIRMKDYVLNSYMFSYIIEKGPRKTFKRKRPDKYVCSRDYGMRDVDLIEKYNLIPHYTNRAELIDLLTNIRRDRMYEIYKTDDYIGGETSISMNTIQQGDVLVLYDGVIYELNEIKDCCRNGMSLNRPFSITLAKDIRAIMDRYNDSVIVTSLNHYIETNIDELIVNSSSLKNNEELNEILKYLVEMGLYARRWRGHGFPYPYKTSDTLKDNNTYKVNMDLLTIRIQKLFNRNNWIRDNMLIYKDYGCTRAKLYPSYSLMVEGKMCIREMSNALIHTGSYYLDKIFGSKYCDSSNNMLDVSQLEFMNPIAPEDIGRQFIIRLR